MLVLNRKGDADGGVEVDPAERTFDDLWPYLGSSIYRGVVRRVLIKPMLNGAKRLVPGRIYTVYDQLKGKYAGKGFLKVLSPLSPALSSYAYNKFEQGIFWGIKSTYSFVIDNVIEF